MISKALVLGVFCLIHTVSATSFEEDLTLSKAEKEALDKVTHELIKKSLWISGCSHSVYILVQRFGNHYRRFTS